MTDEQYAQHTLMFNPRQMEIDREYMEKIASAVREFCIDTKQEHGETVCMLVNAGILLWQHAAEQAVLYGPGEQLENANGMLAGILNSATSYADDVPSLRAVVQAKMDELITIVEGLQSAYNDAMQAAQGPMN